MKLNLKNRDLINQLIILVTKDDNSFYCLVRVEHCIGEYWNGYINLKKGSLESQYFEFLKKFKVDYNELSSFYNDLLKGQDQYELEGNKPQLYIDFGKKYLASYFQEQDLEERVPEGWTGEYLKVEDIIPEKHRYWQPIESS